MLLHPEEVPICSHLNSFRRSRKRRYKRGSRAQRLSLYLSRYTSHILYLCYCINSFAVYAKRNLDAQSMHVVHVCKDDSWHNTYQVDSFCGRLGNCWLGCSSDCLLHRMSTFQRLLDGPSSQPSVHDTRTLCDRPSNLQHQ